MTTCPVCRLRIDEQEAAGTETYRGKTYYFCSQSCLDTFKASTEKYAKQARQSVTSVV